MRKERKKDGSIKKSKTKAKTKIKNQQRKRESYHQRKRKKKNAAGIVTRQSKLNAKDVY